MAFIFYKVQETILAFQWRIYSVMTLMCFFFFFVTILLFKKRFTLCCYSLLWHTCNKILIIHQKVTDYFKDDVFISIHKNFFCIEFSFHDETEPYIYLLNSPIRLTNHPSNLARTSLQVFTLPYKDTQTL